MVLTRLSHVGEVCPLRDHSYSDAIYSHSSYRLVSISTKPSQGTRTSSNNGAASTSTASPSIASSSSVTYIVNISALPLELIEKIFFYLPYKKLCEIRRVCKRFDQICCATLNAAFFRLQNQMLSRFQATKALMPRRESARRKHPLARESDILETLYMRLTLLQMTFGKHIERKHCCFFAGEILDEVYRILRCIKSTSNMGKNLKITDELYDLSTMAMEYFKEHLEPGLPEISYFGSDFLDMTNRFSEGGSGQSSNGGGRISELEDDIPERDPLPSSNMVLRKRIRRIRQGMKRYNTQIVALKRDLKGCKGKINDQSKQIIEYASRFEEYDKKFEESSRKFSTVLQELNKCKTELQYWRSKSPMHPMLCCGCGCGGRLANDTAASSAEARFNRTDDSNKVSVSNPKVPGSNHQPYLILGYNPCSSTSVKNLEPLFDMETLPEQGSLVRETVPASHDRETVPASLARETVPGHRLPCPSAGNYCIDEDDVVIPKRLYSDDDSETDVDTVGSRVRERKRLRLEIH